MLIYFLIISPFYQRFLFFTDKAHRSCEYSPVLDVLLDLSTEQRTLQTVRHSRSTNPNTVLQNEQGALPSGLTVEESRRQAERPKD